MAYTTTGDVAKQLGRPSSSNAEEDQWTAWIDRVERSIAHGFIRAGYALDVQIGLGMPSAEYVADVVVAAVIRKIQNPIFGESSYTRSIDDASETRRSEGAGKVDPLALLDGDWSMLLPVGRRQVGVFSVMPS